MFREGKEKIRSVSGITMIALVITMLVLIIIAGISIAVLIDDNSLVNRTASAKEETEISYEIEAVSSATSRAMAKDKYGRLSKTSLQSIIDEDLGTGVCEIIEIFSLT